MTEAEWLAGTDPTPMLEFLERKASERKLRLLAVSCCWSLERVLCDEAVQLLDVSARVADGLAGSSEMADARQAARTPVMANTPDVLHLRDRGSQLALHASVLTAWGNVDASRAVVQVIHEVLHARRCIGFKHAPSEFAGFIRDIFGPLPFRPVAIDPAWLTSTALAVAEGIYAEKAFDRLPILADALQDSGCDNEDILTHLRSDGPHVKGCWALDLVLGKT